MSTGTLSCVVNVAAADGDDGEFEPAGPAAVRKRVLVVGGGPGGLEAARTAALRGHEVHLHEATRRSAVRWRSPPRARTAPTSAPSPSG